MFLFSFRFRIFPRLQGVGLATTVFVSGTYLNVLVLLILLGLGGGGGEQVRPDGVDRGGGGHHHSPSSPASSRDAPPGLYVSAHHSGVCGRILVTLVHGLLWA